MIPFLHLGPLTIPTYGLMVATGMLVAAYILQADFNRRRGLLQKYATKKNAGTEGVKDEGFLTIGIAGLVGVVGSRVYSVLESPRELIANPSVLISRFGFTWFGGLLGGFVTLLFLARHFKIPTLEFMDMCSPAASVGYAFGRMGCLLSGDGDYGTPTTLPWGMSFPNGLVPTTERVHPTPFYEFLIWVAIGVFLWHLGKKALNGALPIGEIFCGYLILTGVARFLIEIIRINPRVVFFRINPPGLFIHINPGVLFGLSNAQLASILSILIGVILFWRIRAERLRKQQLLKLPAASPGIREPAIQRCVSFPLE